MLKPAILYKTSLSWMIPKILFDKNYKFWVGGSYSTYEVEIDNGFWNKLQMVSVDNVNNVQGFFSADIDRDIYAISNMHILNFSHKPTPIFSFDLKHFVLNLFLKHRFNKVVWRVTVGNPAEIIYEKFCNKYGGRVVGILEKNIKHIDGKLYDEKIYEIILTKFEKAVGEKILVRLRSAHGW